MRRNWPTWSMRWRNWPKRSEHLCSSRGFDALYRCCAQKVRESQPAFVGAELAGHALSSRGKSVPNQLGTYKDWGSWNSAPPWRKEQRHWLPAWDDDLAKP